MKKTYDCVNRIGTIFQRTAHNINDCNSPNLRSVLINFTIFASQWKLCNCKHGLHTRKTLISTM